jgi:hypothetical protein
MSEWWSLLAVFWALYLYDGLYVPRRRRFSFVSWFGGRRARAIYGRFHGLAPLPSSWRAWADDPPFALSPAGIVNQPVGSCGRPVEPPTFVRAWRWEEIRDVKTRRGWLIVNDQPFAPATPQLSAAELLTLARNCAARPAGARSDFLQSRLRLGLRPAHLRRCARAGRLRSSAIAQLNTAVGVLLLALTVYLIGDLSRFLPEAVGVQLGHALPRLLICALLLHVAAVGLAWSAERRARRKIPGRGQQLFTAALLPPQALHLRAWLGEIWFPPMHPLAQAVAFSPPAELRALATQTLADLRWPLPLPGDRDELADAIAAWQRTQLTNEIEALLRNYGLEPAALLAPPPPDAGSHAYCPRCGAQFVAGPTHCPRGIPLLPLQDCARQDRPA